MKRFCALFAVALGLVLFPLAALAQEVAASASSSSLSSVLEELIVAVVIAIIGVFWRRADLSKERRQLILTVSDIAYGFVNEVSRRTSNTIDDKVSLGMAKVIALLRDQGASPELTRGEEAVVRAVFDARHGNEAKAVEALKARPQTPLAAS